VNCHEGGKSVIISYFTYARKILKEITAGIVVIAFLQGCAYYTGMQKKAKNQPLTLDVDSRMPYVLDKQEQPLELDVSARMLLVQDETDSKKQETGPLYRFRAKEIPIVMALDLFARNYDLNIIASPDVTGTVTVDFKDLSLEKSMEVILDAYGYYWSRDGSLIRVYKYETEIFTIDYLRLIREGKGSSQASLSSAEGDESGEITIKQSDTIRFWEDLEEQLKIIVSNEGKIIINRMSGIIQVTDFHKKVMQVKRFLSSIAEIIKRQVEINVKILEVELNDEFSLGIDWNLIAEHIFSLNTVELAADTIVGSPFGVTVPKARSIRLGLNKIGTDKFTAVIDALREQGELNIISRPSIRVLNNQPALIKVGTDIPFFDATTTIGVPPQPNTVTEEVRFVTDGLVLSITPQISEEGLIILDVTPIISRFVATTVSSFGSTAPRMDVKQSSTVVQLRDGEMVTIGGLIRDSDSQTNRKVPVLGDIPLMGNLFKGRYTKKIKSELVMFITPKIITGL
jgi:MSHA biogenesis protein MshL